MRSHTITGDQGIISGGNRTVEEIGTSGTTPTTLKNAIQTSAPINAGNSGGPLVSLSGKVVGIASAAARGPRQAPPPASASPSPPPPPNQ